MILVISQLQAQTDTLGKYPFIFTGDLPETGIYHDSTYCEVTRSYFCYDVNACWISEISPFGPSRPSSVRISFPSAQTAR